MILEYWGWTKALEQMPGRGFFNWAFNPKVHAMFKAEREAERMRKQETAAKTHASFKERAAIKERMAAA